MRRILFLLLFSFLLISKTENSAQSPYLNIQKEISNLLSTHFPAKAINSKKDDKTQPLYHELPAYDKKGTSARYADWILRKIIVGWVTIGKREKVMNKMRELLIRWKFNSKKVLGANPFISGFLALMAINFFLLYLQRQLTLYSLAYECIFAAFMIYFLSHYNYIFNLLDSTLIHPMGILVEKKEWTEAYNALFAPINFMVSNSGPFDLLKAPLKLILHILCYLILLPMLESPFIIPNFLVGLIYLVGPFIITLSALQAFRNLLKSWFMNLLTADMYMLFMFVLYYVTGGLIGEYIIVREKEKSILEIIANYFTGDLDFFIFLGAYVSFLVLLNFIAFSTAKSVVSGVMSPFKIEPPAFTPLQPAEMVVKTASDIK